MRSVVWMTWRWRLERSTLSSSTIPIVPDARGGEVQRGRRAEAAGAEQQHLGVEQLLLALDADLRQQEVARVALALLGGELARDLDLVAAVLPQRDAAGHRPRRPRSRARVERVGGERGARAGGAVDDDGRRAVGHGALDAGLEVAARDVLGAREVAAVPLLGLPDVDERNALAARQLVDLGRVDLLDLLLDLTDELGSGWAHVDSS